MLPGSNQDVTPKSASAGAEPSGRGWLTRRCSDCRWAADTERYGGEFAVCNAPQNMKAARNRTGFVGEERERRWKYCQTNRLGIPILFDLFSPLLGDCGPLGRWWRPKALSAPTASPAEASPCPGMPS